MRKSYVVMTVGGALFVSGIALIVISILYLLPQQFLHSNIRSDFPYTTNRFLLQPYQSRNVSVNIPVLEEEFPLAAAITSNQSDVSMHASITNPNGQIDNQTSFKDTALLLVEDPRVRGNYNLTITNDGPRSTFVDVIFGYSPIIGKGGQLNIGWAGAFAAGGGMIIAGIVVGVIGIIMRKRD